MWKDSREKGFLPRLHELVFAFSRQEPRQPRGYLTFDDEVPFGEFDASIRHIPSQVSRLRGAKKRGISSGFLSFVIEFEREVTHSRRSTESSLVAQCRTVDLPFVFVLSIYDIRFLSRSPRSWLTDVTRVPFPLETILEVTRSLDVFQVVVSSPSSSSVGWNWILQVQVEIYRTPRFVPRRW